MNAIPVEPTIGIREQQRLDATLTLIPKDVATGLEIGFSDLRMSGELSRKFDLVSIDLPRQVSKHGGRKMVFCDIAELAFPDNSFDLVICTEVLEHLTDDHMARGVLEMRRVSRKYILVSVPYKQRVWNELSKCPQCGYVVNTMGHRHYFDERKLHALFQGSKPISTQLIGQTGRYAPDFLYRLRRNLGNDWHLCEWGCFSCGAPPEPIEPNLLGKLIRSVVWRWEGVLGPKPAFLLVLFQCQ